MTRPFTTHEVGIQEYDQDVILTFPNGKKIEIQIRYSNGDEHDGSVYLGSLDIVLPDNTAVTNWEGDEMKPAKALRGEAHTRIAKQLVLEIPQ